MSKDKTLAPIYPGEILRADLLEPLGISINKLSEETVKDVVSIAGYQEKSLSVAFEEVEPKDWADKVYRRDILDNQQKLYKKQGYNPFD